MPFFNSNIFYLIFFNYFTCHFVINFPPPSKVFIFFYNKKITFLYWTIYYHFFFNFSPWWFYKFFINLHLLVLWSLNNLKYSSFLFHCMIFQLLKFYSIFRKKKFTCFIFFCFFDQLHIWFNLFKFFDHLLIIYLIFSFFIISLFTINIFILIFLLQLLKFYSIFIKKKCTFFNDLFNLFVIKSFFESFI